MSRHEGVSCDSCNKNNFRGKRFKCLVCYDYDLCAQCHDSGAVTTRHSKDHPMQCILTRTDFELYYGGEALTVDQPQSFCCPFCGKLGLTDSGLQEHVSSEHPETMTEVVCPVCAALPRGDPNHVTDDFIAHLNLEHRAPSMRDFDEPTTSSRGRRILHGGRSLGQVRARRTTNQNFAASPSSTSSTTTPLLNHGSSSSGVRDTIDPIAKLLSQLSGVRRSAQQSQQSVQSQLQLLQQQLQFEREQVQQTRERLERLPRRPLNSCSTGATTTNTTSATTRQETASSAMNSGFLLSRCNDTELPESEQVEMEVKRARRSLFVQDLLVSTLGELSLDSDGTESYDDLESEENCSAEPDLDPSQGETSTANATSASKQPLSEDMELINLEDDKDL